MINLTPFSPSNPIQIDEKVYQHSVTQKRKSWTHCGHEIEWLCKLRYIRMGVREKKISSEEFQNLEERLVMRWWDQWV